MEESRCKKLHANSFVNHQLHLALYNKTIQVVESTGLPFFIIDKAKQQSDNFGENLADTIAFVFSKNYEVVIAIGNDCPQLSADTLLDAALKMKHHQMVVGPDRNGGIYLLGITANLFNRNTISAIPWQTKNVFTSLLKYKETSLKQISVLDELSDFNKLSDYNFLQKILRSINGFIALIATIISGIKLSGFAVYLSTYTSCFLSKKQLRGPPSYC